MSSIVSLYGVATVIGGSYRNAPTTAHYVDKFVCLEKSLCKGLDNYREVEFFIRDFSVPSVDSTMDFVHSVYMDYLTAQAPLTYYIGCSGGIGRTGTVLAVMLETFSRMSDREFFVSNFFKFFDDFFFDPRLAIEGLVTPNDPVANLRAVYSGPKGETAIETREQEQFVRDFPYNSLIKELRSV